MSWLVRYDLGSGWVDITSQVDTRSFQRVRRLHQDLKSTIDQVTFDLIPGNPTILNAFLGAPGDINVNIQKDSVDYFTGYVRDNYASAITNKLAPIKIEVNDPGILLNDIIVDTFSFQDAPIWNSASPGGTILYELLVVHGPLELTDIDSDNVAKEIQSLTIIGDETTHADVLSKILFDFGYVWNFDESGKLYLTDLFPAVVTSTKTYNYTNMQESLRLNRRGKRYEGVQIEWQSTEVLNSRTLFRETNHTDESLIKVFTRTIPLLGDFSLPLPVDAESLYECSVILDPGDYYPANSDAGPIYAEYEVDGREIVYTASTTPVIVAYELSAGNVIGNRSTAYAVERAIDYGKRMDLSIMATSRILLTTIRVSGSPTVFNALNRTRYENIAATLKLWRYESEFIRDTDDAAKLAVGIAGWYENARLTWTFKNAEDDNVGTIATLSESIETGANQSVRLIQVVDNEFTGVDEYTVEALEPYDVGETFNAIFRGRLYRPPQPPADLRPTYAQIEGGEIVVAASDYLDSAPAGFVCDGLNDEEEIQNAVDSLSTQGGGQVRLTRGTFYLDDILYLGENIRLVGDGAATQIVMRTVTARIAIVEADTDQDTAISSMTIRRLVANEVDGGTAATVTFTDVYDFGTAAIVSSDILDGGDSVSTFSQSTEALITVDATDGAFLNNLVLRDGYGPAIWVRDSINVEISGVKVDNCAKGLFLEGAVIDGGTAATAAFSAGLALVDDRFTEAWDFGDATGTGTDLADGGSATTDYSRRVRAINNAIDFCPVGIEVNCPGALIGETTIHGNTATGYGIKVRGRKAQIVGAQISECGDVAIDIEGRAHSITGVNVSNNAVNGIGFNIGPTSLRPLISASVVENTDTGFNIESGATDTIFSGCIAAENTDNFADAGTDTQVTGSLGLT